MVSYQGFGFSIIKSIYELVSNGISSSAWFPANTVILNNLLKLTHDPGFLETQFSGRILNLEDCDRERTNSKFCEIKELRKN